MKIDEFGNKKWRNEEGLLHRIDGPAIEYIDGSKHWYRNGELHREDGPAVERMLDIKEYWYNGVKFFKIKNDAEWNRIVRLMVLR